LAASVAADPGAGLRRAYSPRNLKLARLVLFVSRLAENRFARVVVLGFAAAAAWFLSRAGHGTASLSPGLALVVFGQILAGWLCSLFRPLRKVTSRWLLGRVALTSLLVALLPLLLPPLPGSWGGTLRHSALGLSLLLPLFWLLQRLERRRRDRVLLLGPWKETDNFLHALRTLPSRARPIYPDESSRCMTRDEQCLQAPEALFKETRPDEVYLVRRSFREEDILRMLEVLPPSVSVYVVPTAWDSIISRLALGPTLGDLRIFEIRSPLEDRDKAAIKRGIDIVASLVLLLLLSPLLAVLALLIAMGSAGPIFYYQTRICRRGKLFRILKLRTMRADAETGTGPVLSDRDDPRVTRIGRRLRALGLDELPQLWNVLKGEMSLVGPRPERPEIADAYRISVPGYNVRQLVRPGMTGLAQIYGRYGSAPYEKMRFDLAYIYNYSLGLDLVVCLRTVWVLLTGSRR